MRAIPASAISLACLEWLWRIVPESPSHERAARAMSPVAMISEMIITRGRMNPPSLLPFGVLVVWWPLWRLTVEVELINRLELRS